MGARRTFVAPDCDPESTKLASVTPRVCAMVSRQICPYREKQGMQVLQRKERRRGGWKRKVAEERWIRNELGKVSHWFLH